MAVGGWSERLAPDVLRTWRRFPLAVPLQVLATLVALAVINDWLSSRDEFWARAFGGLATGAAFSVAGNLFAESRLDRRRLGLVLAYVVPLAVVALCQVRDSTNFVPYLLPVISIFWMSVAGFLRIGKGVDAAAQQDRFWWLNHRAFTSAVLAVAGFVIVSIGFFAIEQSLSILFGLRTGDVFEKGVLPVAGLLLAPVYWLATLPRLDEYEPGSLVEPDFISRAIGFLGQFILAPILIAYAAILLAYAAQIALSRQFPNGMLGWMVLGFTSSGAATWLLLHPAFLRGRLLVGFFRRAWFWMTIVPLGLFAVAVGMRIGAYGLTVERMLLVAGGVWAGALTLAFLLGRGDIRFIPGVAGLLFVVLSIGPWNLVNAPRVDQALRLERALTEAGASGKGGAPHWTPETADDAKGAIGYLSGEPEGRRLLARVLSRHAYDYDGVATDTSALVASLGFPATSTGLPNAGSSSHVERAGDAPPIDLTATPFYLGPVSCWVGADEIVGGRHFRLVAGNRLTVTGSANATVTVDLDAWTNAQGRNTLETPTIDFDFEGRKFRIAVEAIDITGPDGAGPQTLTYLTGSLFSAAAVPAKSTP